MAFRARRFVDNLASREAKSDTCPSGGRIVRHDKPAKWLGVNAGLMPGPAFQETHRRGNVPPVPGFRNRTPRSGHKAPRK